MRSELNVEEVVQRRSLKVWSVDFVFYFDCSLFLDKNYLSILYITSAHNNGGPADMNPPKCCISNFF